MSPFSPSTFLMLLNTNNLMRTLQIKTIKKKKFAIGGTFIIELGMSNKLFEFYR